MKKMTLPLRDQLIAQYAPTNPLTRWAFIRQINAVLQEAKQGLQDDKLKAFQQRNRPTKEDTDQYWRFIFLTCDMVAEYRKAIGAESYLEIHRRSRS